MAKMMKPIIFQTPELAKLLKADRFTLNRLMLRCGIEPHSGIRGRGKVLVFSGEGVGAVAIAYWLFRSGLRPPAIKDALGAKEIEGLCQNLVSVVDMEQIGSQFSYLVAWRVVEPKKGKKKEKVWQKVRLARDIAEVQRTLESEKKQFGFVVVPIGRLLKELAERIRKSQIRK